MESVKDPAPMTTENDLKPYEKAVAAITGSLNNLEKVTDDLVLAMRKIKPVVVDPTPMVEKEPEDVFSDNLIRVADEINYRSGIITKVKDTLNSII